VYLLCAEHAWVLLYNRPETTSLAKSDQIAQGMAQSAAWQSGHRESTQCLGDKPSYTYTQCAQGWLPVQAGGYSVWHVCWACVTDTCWVARLCMFLCAPLCVRVCAQRLELGIGWNFKTSYLARSRHELSVLVFGDVFLYLDKHDACVFQVWALKCIWGRVVWSCQLRDKSAIFQHLRVSKRGTNTPAQWRVGWLINTKSYMVQPCSMVKWLGTLTNEHTYFPCYNKPPTTAAIK